MDTSEQYIKMCEKAKEIQNLKTLGNLVWDDVLHNKVEITPVIRPLTREEFIWLPRQDQLQEMIKGSRHMHLLAHQFAVYFHGSDSPVDNDIGRDDFTVDSDYSMEQMWLAFVMKEKYNKTWNGKEWREQK